VQGARVIALGIKMAIAILFALSVSELGSRTLGSVKAGRDDDEGGRKLRGDRHEHVVEGRQVVCVTL